MGRDHQTKQHHKKNTRTTAVSEEQEKKRIRENILEVFKARLSSPNKGGALIVGEKPADEKASKQPRTKHYKRTDYVASYSSQSSDGTQGVMTSKRTNHITYTSRKKQTKRKACSTKHQTEKESAVSKHMKIAHGVTCHNEDKIGAGMIAQSRLTHKVGLINTGKKGVPASRVLIPSHISRQTDAQIQRLVSEVNSEFQASSDNGDRCSGHVSGASVGARSRTPASVEMGHLNHITPSSTDTNYADCKQLEEILFSKDLDLPETVMELIAGLKSVRKQMFPGRDFYREKLYDILQTMKQRSGPLSSGPVSAYQSSMARYRDSNNHCRPAHDMRSWGDNKCSWNEIIGSRRGHVSKGHGYLFENNLADGPKINFSSRNPFNSILPKRITPSDQSENVFRGKYYISEAGDSSKQYRPNEDNSRQHIRPDEDKSSVSVRQHIRPDEDNSPVSARQHIRPDDGNSSVSARQHIRPDDGNSSVSARQHIRPDECKSSVLSGRHTRHDEANRSLSPRQHIRPDEGNSSVSPRRYLSKQTVLDELTLFLKSRSDGSSKRHRWSENKSNSHNDDNIDWFTNVDKNDNYNFFLPCDENSQSYRPTGFCVDLNPVAGDQTSISPSMSVEALLRANDRNMVQQQMFEPMDVEQRFGGGDMEEGDALGLLKKNDLLLAITEQHERTAATRDIDMSDSGSRRDSQCSHCSHHSDKQSSSGKFMPSFHDNYYSDQMATADLAWQHNYHRKIESMDILDYVDQENHGPVDCGGDRSHWSPSKGQTDPAWSRSDREPTHMVGRIHDLLPPPPVTDTPLYFPRKMY
ncbi:uncharacterized protein LOC128230293 [Mya arenaria]|uniref:uncharacterized protein LOC128230293 n=1 Tax=Mya arenaria TaxID=6604 RepID=UPI0022E02787|nr:uncharacterized protein LOC128230293 [Mya arenaria]XP_052798407.1 uncharacterized protein LOC128230293 [Mya arenaria]